MMSGIVEGECDPIGFIIQFFVMVALVILALRFFQEWPTLAIKATEICFGGACP
jgi:hypothetical protein